MIHDRSRAISRSGSRMRRTTLAIAVGFTLLACELVIGDPPSNGDSAARGGAGLGAQSGGRLNDPVGTGGSVASGGTLPGDSTKGGAAGFATVGAGGGTAPYAGASSIPESGASGSPEAGAAGAVGVAGAGGTSSCAMPLTWYQDEDADGYGTDISISACGTPSGRWSLVEGDCDDTLADVHPTQQKYFGVPYEKSDGTESFDYDCSGSEEPNPSLTLAREDCGLLKVALCSDESGYVTNYRSGPGIYEWCGSTVVRTCVPSALVCETSERQNQRPFGCR